jgi:hypothetical protein
MRLLIIFFLFITHVCLVVVQGQGTLSLYYRNEPQCRNTTAPVRMRYNPIDIFPCIPSECDGKNYEASKSFCVSSLNDVSQYVSPKRSYFVSIRYLDPGCSGRIFVGSWNDDVDSSCVTVTDGQYVKQECTNQGLMKLSFCTKEFCKSCGAPQYVYNHCVNDAEGQSTYLSCTASSDANKIRYNYALIMLLSMLLLLLICQ